MVFPARDFKLGDIKNIVNYTYVSQDNSILNRWICSPLFNTMHEYIPRGITPNQLTLAGFVAMLMSFTLTLWLDPSLDSAPRFLPLLNFLLLAFYFTMDNLDGLRARAQKRCTPFGSILDHSVDSFCCFFFVPALASSLRIGMGRFFVSLQVSIGMVFYFGVLHHKYVGFFSFGYISGCVEGIILVLAVHLLSFFNIIPHRFSAANILSLSESNFINILCLLSFVLLSFNAVQLLISVINGPFRYKVRNFIVSLYSISLLFTLFVAGYASVSNNSLFFRWTLVSVFCLVFAVCYLEETISTITKNKTDERIFVFSFISILMTAVLSTLGIPNSHYYVLLGAVCVFAFSAMRIGSIFSVLRQHSAERVKSKVC